MVKFLLDLFKKGRKDSSSSIVVEEISIEGRTEEKVEKQDIKIERPKTYDEVKKFIEVTNILREFAGLPSVEEVAKAGETNKPKEEVSASKEEKTPLQPEIKEENVKTERPEEKKPLYSKEEIDRVVKVSMMKLEKRLMELMNEQMKEEGITSFRERARMRRNVKEYIKEHTDLIVDYFVDAIKSGKDPVSDEFIENLAKDILSSVYERKEKKVENVQTSTEKEKKEEKEEKKKDRQGSDDDLSELLGVKTSEKKPDEEEDDDILKLLSEI